MLQLRPNCELCDCDLPPHDQRARIFTYECTFCVSCVEEVLKNVCPNCAGGFVPRPIRPKTAHRPGVSVKDQPPSRDRVHSSRSREEIEIFSMDLKDIAPEDR